MKKPPEGGIGSASDQNISALTYLAVTSASFKGLVWIQDPYILEDCEGGGQPDDGLSVLTSLDASSVMPLLTLSEFCLK